MARRKSNKKVIFAGLDYSGKTSILNVINQKYSNMNEKPTVGISRSPLTNTSLFGLQIQNWDLGGQSKFRKDYFNQRFRVFSDVFTLFYVIDVQQAERYDESMEYLADIGEILKIMKEKANIIILLHKVDPDVKEDSDIRKNIVNLIDKINNVEFEFNFHLYETTIFDMSSVLLAFSDGVIKNSDRSKLIEEKLKDFSRSTFSSSVILFTDDLLTIASHSSKQKYFDVSEMVAPRFIQAMGLLPNYDLIPENVIVNVTIPEDDNSKAIIFVRTFKIEGLGKFHIVTLSRNERTFKLSHDKLPNLATDLKNLMEAMELGS